MGNQQDAQNKDDLRNGLIQMAQVNQENVYLMFDPEQQTQKMFLREFVKRRLQDIKQLEEIEKTENYPEFQVLQNNIFKDFFTSLMFIQHLSNIILWEPIPNATMKHVIVIGNMGNGKSTLLNKLAYIINKLENNVDQQDLAPFEAIQATQSVTVDVNSYTAGDITLLDTPGFGDPQVNQYKLWNQLILNLLNKDEAQLDKNGIATIIFAIMIPTSLRVDEETTKILYETLMLLTLIYPDFDTYKHKWPKILVCLQGKHQEKFEEFKQALYYYIALKIHNHIHKTQFDFIQGHSQDLYWKSQHNWQGEVSNVKHILISNKTCKQSQAVRYDENIESYYSLYDLASYIKENEKYKDCIGFSIHKNFFKPQDNSEKLCWVLMKNNNRDKFKNNKIETYYWDYNRAQEFPGQPVTDEHEEIYQTKDQDEIQIQAIVNKLKIIIPEDNFFFQGHSKFKHTSKDGELYVREDDIKQVEQIYECIKNSRPMGMSNLFNPFDQPATQDKLEQYSFFTPPELSVNQVNDMAENIYRLLNNLINATRAQIDEQNMQIYDENGPAYCKKLAHFIEIINFSKQRMQECLGQDKTFVLQKACDQFFTYIGKLIIIMNDEFLVTMLTAQAEQKSEFISYVTKMQNASAF